MKTRASIWGLCLILLAPASWAQVTFLNPNRGAALYVSLKTRNSYSPRAIPVTVMITNQSQEPLLLNQRLVFNHYQLDGELIFIIEDPEGNACLLDKVITPRGVSDTDFAELGVGSTVERGADLADLFALKKRGTYRVQVLYRNKTPFHSETMDSWQGVAASEPTEFVLQ